MPAAFRTGLRQRVKLGMLWRAGALSRRLSEALHMRYRTALGLAELADVPRYTTPRELDALLTLASRCRPGANVLEIGSYVGVSSCHLAAGLLRRGGRLFCVDTWNNETMPEGPRDTYADFLNNTRRFAGTIRPLRMRSAELLAAHLQLPLDLVFIDGDHSYEAVRADFERVAPWLAPQGLIALHDVTTYPGVSRLVGELLAGGQWALAGQVDSLVWLRRPRWIDTPWLTPSAAAAPPDASVTDLPQELAARAPAPPRARPRHSAGERA